MKVGICQSNKTHITECIICSENINKEKGKHSCTVCKIDAWYICSTCNSKIDRCPVCRTPNNPLNGIIISIEENVQVPIQENNNQRQKECFEYIKIILLILRPILLFFLFMYLGKIYISGYCHITCSEKDEKLDKCMCIKFAQRDNYWGDFNYCIGEIFTGLLGTCILYGCCIRRH